MQNTLIYRDRFYTQSNPGNIHFSFFFYSLLNFEKKLAWNVLFWEKGWQHLRLIPLGFVVTFEFYVYMKS